MIMCVYMYLCICVCIDHEISEYVLGSGEEKNQILREEGKRRE